MPAFSFSLCCWSGLASWGAGAPSSCAIMVPIQTAARPKTRIDLNQGHALPGRVYGMARHGMAWMGLSGDVSHWAPGLAWLQERLLAMQPDWAGTGGANPDTPAVTTARPMGAKCVGTEQSGASGSPA
jgi:hypothetical protein